MVTWLQCCPMKSAAPVANKVGMVIEKYPSVLNSLIGVPPMVGHMRVLVDPLCRSWMDWQTVSSSTCSVAQHWEQMNLEGVLYIDLLEMVGWGPL